jgi:hypothetical protein
MTDVRTPRRPDPGGQIALWAATFGGIAFAAGFLGPIVLSTSNLGPLLGIFVTGPMGALVGAVAGALRVATQAPRTSLIVVGSVWLLTLAYTWFAMFFGTFGAIILPIQLLVIASTIYILARPATRAQLSNDLRRAGPIIIAAQAIALVMTLFPPAVRAWWSPVPGPDAAPIPPFPFILDGRFNAGRNTMLPNRSELALEWLVTIAVAVAIIMLMRRRRSNV